MLPFLLVIVPYSGNFNSFLAFSTVKNEQKKANIYIYISVLLHFYYATVYVWQSV